MKTILFAWLMMLAIPAAAQVTKITLQAGGLTCSMCSKAVKLALDEVSFVEKVMVDIRNQQYNITIKENASVELDKLKQAVEDAGFSVAALKVTAKMNKATLAKDEHIKIGDQYFHFLNGSGKEVNETTVFSVVDKNFVPEKEFESYSGLTTMECVHTGKTATCCSAGNTPVNVRVYHAIL